MKIHQMIAGAGVGDAITNYAFEIQKLMHHHGIQSEIFAPRAHTAKDYIDTRVKSLELLQSQIDQSDLLIYHYSIGSESSKLYQSLGCIKIICYHNVTPQKYFTNLSETQVRVLKKGRELLKEIIPCTKIALAVSEYNLKELKDIGFSNTARVPLVFPKDYLTVKPDLNWMNMYNDGVTNVLFVGRVVPNKKFEDIISVFHEFDQIHDKPSRLICAGSYVGNEKYYTYLKSLVYQFDLGDKVIFTGHVTLAQLLACYRSSHAFLCMSEHEGFGLPLIESMHFQIPVFAMNHAAVPETLGEAGILIHEKNDAQIAKLMDIVLNKQDLLQKIIDAQNERLKEFTHGTLKQKLGQILKEYLNLDLFLLAS